MVAKPIPPWNQLNEDYCITSSFVLDQFFTDIARIGGYRLAAEKAQEIYALEGSKLEILRPILADELLAAEMLGKFSDVNFTDCISFALMNAHQIPFNNDFKIFKYFNYIDSCFFIRDNIFIDPMPSNFNFRNSVFIDTSAFLAGSFKKDQHHEDALKAWKSIKQEKIQCYTSNFVLDEFFTLLAKRVDHVTASKQAKALLNSSDIKIMRPTRETEVKASSFFNLSAGSKISFTDCVSFILMEEYRIERAFSFDSDFEKPGGFHMYPETKGSRNRNV
ncbi:MAG: PIN domain-containing protein [Parachlamydia sp.]|jgi:predicted nucleic acid-binding protein|nr:PIN domain-containing protein [Parachlamydia sp.]